MAATVVAEKGDSAESAQRVKDMWNQAAEAAQNALAESVYNNEAAMNTSNDARKTALSAETEAAVDLYQAMVASRQAEMGGWF